MNFNNERDPIIYKSTLDKVKANIIYLHGGGFVFGNNDDLPSYHIKKINGAGYNILSFNYPLSPESSFDTIIDYVISTINTYAEDMDLPYFLWGRSAGAYLSLFAPSKELIKAPNGVISYYGYGLLAEDWYSSPSDYYLKYSSVDYDSVKNLIQEKPILSSPSNPRFLLYLYTRQKGKWLETLSPISTQAFLEKFSLRDEDFSKYPPVLLAHNTRDNDVPYQESLLLSEKIKQSKLLSFTSPEHDFDKNTASIDTRKLIKETIRFLDENIKK